MTESHVRSLAKAVSWRATGTLDTFLISWLVTGQALLAGGIAATEVLTKVVLFYLHERAWSRVRWGRGAASPSLDARGAASPPVDARGAAAASTPG
jgi:uncharacterized membrane protein